MFAGKTVLPYLSAFGNAIVFKGALEISRFTLFYLQGARLIFKVYYTRHDEHRIWHVAPMKYTEFEKRLCVIRTLCGRL